jgi:uncharacterized repeat protein (TIGR02543 family)
MRFFTSFWLILTTIFFTQIGWGQLTLGTSPYTQDFDAIGSGLPTGWTTRSTSSTTVLGTIAALTTAKTLWTDTGGSFKNVASADGLTSGSSTAVQNNSTDRALGVRQSGSFADPGAGFLLQLANTTGKQSFVLKFKLQSLDISSNRLTTWRVDYGTGATPSAFTNVASSPASLTTGNATFSNTDVTVNLPAAINDLSGNVWIRIVSIAASTGTGNRATTAIDDVELSWTIVPSSYTLTYNGNTNTGGTAPVDGSSPYTPSSTVTVLGNTGSLIKTGYAFTGWNTAANGSGTTYSPGATFTITANTVLYAQWAPVGEILTDDISGGPFSVNCGATAAGQVFFVAQGNFASGNTFTVQLSNSAGSFASPTSIGSASINGIDPFATINVTIPTSQATGSGYRVRIVSSNPVFTSDTSSVFTITNTPCSITPTVNGSPFAVDCGAGANGTVSFTSVGTYASGNVYTVQMSNASGSFASPTAIGTLTSNANSGTINVTIPAGTASGTGYKVRILSNNPSLTGSESSVFTITNTPCSITPTVNGSPFAVDCGAGANGTISFTSVGTYASGNVYTVQMSNASGSFASPTTIGTLTSNANSGTINVTIPAGTASGTGYKVRILSSTPSLTGSESSVFTINNTPCSITTNSITSSLFSISCSAGANGQITYTATGTYISGNTFRVQLSDLAGSFTSPTVIGSIATTSLTGTINVTIPIGTPSGTGYRVRVISDNPVITGTTFGTNITVNNSCGPCLEESFETSNSWSFSGGASRMATTARTGSYSATFTSNGEVFSPLINNVNGISFWYRRSSTSPTSPAFSAYISTSPSGPWTQVGTTVTTLTTTYQQFTASFTPGNYYVRILHTRASGANQVYMDDFEASCVECSHTVTTFSPTSGPVGTEITITGTGFTSSTTVRVGGVAAVVTFLNSTTLTAKVQAGAITGDVEVIEGGCIVIPATFTVIEESGTCTPNLTGMTDIFISEVYDSETNNVWNMELYNPTGSPINLGTNNYQIQYFSAIGNPSAARTISLSGTIPAYGVFTLVLGSSTNTCSFAADMSQSGSGINANVEIKLVKNGTPVDVVHTPNQAGYSLLRNNNAVAPSTTYNVVDWDVQTTESCNNLGAYTVNYYRPTVSAITSNSCSSLDFSVTATAGNGGALTYKWYYNNGVSLGWTQVISSTFTGLIVSGETTNHLIITPGAQPITDIDGFQFYCEVTENGTCIDVSDAEQFISSSDRYYKSTQSGNWATTSTWLTAPAVSGPWVAACTYPTATNSDYISIENGHTVTLNIDLSADQIIVQTTGILQLNEKLTVPNGNAATEDLQIIGTLIDNGNTTNGLEFTGGGTWLLDAQGTVVKTWSSSVAQYKNNYQGGIATIPATAKWYYRYVGNDNVATTTEGMYYPNLYFESNSGFHSWDAADEVLNGSTATAIVKGNLSVGRTNTGTVELFNNNTFATPVSVLGNVYVGAGSSLRNNSQGTGIGTGFDIKGDSVLVNGTYSIDASGTGKTIFSGAAMQHIVSTASGIFNGAHVELNNANGARLNGIDMNISSTLTFVTGILHTIIAQTDKVNITNSATTAIVGAQAQSAFNRYIDGKLQWLTASGSTYVFPVGANKVTYGAQGFNFTVDNGNGAVLAYLEMNTSAPILDYAYCDLETHPGAGTVNVGNGNPGYDGILDQVNFNLRSQLQWHITNPSGAITQYDITVLATGNQNINPVVSANGEAIRYLMKNGQPGNPNVSTITATGFSDSGFDMCPNQYTLLNLTSFSLFTLDGATQSGTVLPIEMVSFTGTAVHPNSAQLNWVTASELNNDYFTLLYSADGFTFEPLAEIDGAGTSKSILNYTYRHNHLSKGVHYYRLLSTDFDGKTYDRGAVAVEIDLNQIYYNSVTSSIELPSVSNAKIYSTEGKLVAEGNGVNSIPFHHKGLFLIYFVDTGTTERIVVR